MTSHTKLQYYRRNYGKVFMTGLLGCRWHRYKQSTNGSRKRDIAWLLVLVLTGLFISFWLYFNLIAQNDQYDFNWYMSAHSNTWWFRWHYLFLVVVCVLFSYIILLLLLSLCHVVYGHQLYVHPVNLFFIILTLLLCVAYIILICEVWSSEWRVLYLSLQMFYPFLQIGFVSLMTVLTWTLSKEWLKLTKPGWKLVTGAMYILTLLALYLSPLLVRSPCVVVKEALPGRPALFAHKGASGLAPENTMVAFELASKYQYVEGISTGVQISYNGVPFLLHDKNLQHTTNVEEVYPHLRDSDPSMLNFTQLSNLSTGSWFLKHDPYSTVGRLSKTDIARYNNQSIPTLLDFLLYTHKMDLSVMFDVQLPSHDHPYYADFLDIIFDVISISGINQTKVYWLYTHDVNVPAKYKRVSGKNADIHTLRSLNITGVNLMNNDVHIDTMRSYKENNVTTFTYMVNSGWLYSFYWCLGVDYVHTDRCDVLSQLSSPIWQMEPNTYLALWITVDFISLLIVVIIIIIQRSRLNLIVCSADQVSVHSQSSGNVWRNHPSRRSMKEKLLMRDRQADMFDLDIDDDFGIESNGYDVTVTASEGRVLSEAFHSNRASYHSNVENGGSQQTNRNSTASNVLEFTTFCGNNENGSAGYSQNGLHSNGSVSLGEGQSYQTEAEMV